MYKSTGLAELVDNPSKITRKYLANWFNANASLGKALKKLGIPFNKIDIPLLVYKKDLGLVIDLKAEEEIIYKKTALYYKKQNNNFELALDKYKLLNPILLIGTLRLIWSQSKLLINYQNTYNKAKRFAESIPTNLPDEKTDIENDLENKVLPNLIAIDYLSEFAYSALTHSMTDQQKIETITKLHKRTRENDWYTKAILAWEDLKDGKIKEAVFVEKYGIAAGNDFELAKPRFYEQLKAKKPATKKFNFKNMEVKTLEDLYVGLQYLRSKSKHVSLFWIDALREKIVKS